MTYLDYLIEAGKSSATQYDNFIRDYPKIGDGLYIFVEGVTDKSYYEIMINKATQNKYKIKLYDCGNRSGVIKMRDAINERDLPYGVIPLFFIDRDYADIFNVECTIRDILITDGYSFENYILDDKALRSVWESGVNIRKSGIVYEEIRKKYVICYIKIAKIVREFASFVIYRRRFHKTDNIILQSIKFKQMYGINDNLEIEIREDVIDAMAKKSGLFLSKNSQRRKDIYSLLRRQSSIRYFRGKFFLKFTLSFLEKVYEIGKKVDSDFGFNFDLTEKGFVNYVCARLEAPLSMSNYLSGRLEV